MARRQFPHTTPGGEGRCVVNRAEILAADASLTSAHARSLRLEEISRAESAAPTMTPPLAPGASHRLRDMRGVLVKRRDDLAALDRRATIFRERLPSASAKLDTLESSVNPDASRDELLDFAVETIRLDLLKSILGNYPEKRRAAEKEVGAALTDLSRLFGEIQPQLQTSEQKFMAGHTLESRLAIGRAEIDSLLIQ